MITTNIVSLKSNQDKEQKHTVGFVNSCKTKKKCKKCSGLKTISVHHHIGLQLLQFVLRNTFMVQYKLVGSCCFCLCKIVRLQAVNALRIWSRKAHNRTVCSWVPFCEASKAQCQTVCSCWVHNCNTISSEHHVLYSSCTWYCKTRMVRYRLVGSCCFCLCKPVHVWVVNAQNSQGTVPK